ncbi:hypothetical protein EUTSA_v10009254mg [Eutrema salsugineum]|uniref:Uncharacterized protein n=1 Tax=Eutrema salsugineum TaxID=72664 RepID=V4KDU7_EUTSA|nr:hypothetical protein EUTSA_v10009254mg [Eutrema salsugineum]
MDFDADPKNSNVMKSWRKGNEKRGDFVDLKKLGNASSASLIPIKPSIGILGLTFFLFFLLKKKQIEIAGSLRQ